VEGLGLEGGVIGDDDEPEPGRLGGGRHLRGRPASVREAAVDVDDARDADETVAGRLALTGSGRHQATEAYHRR
jgi:hypothetical protein